MEFSCGFSALKMNQKMAIVPKFFTVFVIFIALGVSISAEEEEDDEANSRAFGFLGGSNRPCQYRRSEGFCKRRSECRRPTRQTCRIGLNPVICCLDKEPTTTTTKTTTKKPQRPTSKPMEVKEIDLTFPKCGLRSPKVSESLSSGRGRPAPSATSPRRGGFLRRRWSRWAVPHARRFKRQGLMRPVIVGGVEARSYSWPWMVAIFRSSGNGSGKRFLCGASLVSRNYVVTAAHCFDGERGNIDPSKFTVVVGAHKTNEGTEYPVESILLHPDYRQRIYYADLSVIRVAEPVKLNNKTYPVCLPSDGLRGKIRPGQNNVTVTGWGDTTFGGVSSKVLQEVTLPIVPLKECNESYWKVARANFPKGINNLFICAGLAEGGKDACQGDSGGPMVAKLSDNSWVQLGVVSFGYGCARPGFPGVYTRLSEFTRWFYENTDLGKL